MSTSRSGVVLTLAELRQVTGGKPVRDGKDAFNPTLATPGRQSSSNFGFLGRSGPGLRD